jgi:hypothetical protein
MRKPWRPPLTVGLKATCTAQLPRAGREAVQLLAVEAKSPVSCTCMPATGLLPGLVIVMI